MDGSPPVMNKLEKHSKPLRKSSPTVQTNSLQELTYWISSIGLGQYYRQEDRHKLPSLNMDNRNGKILLSQRKSGG